MKSAAKVAVRRASRNLRRESFGSIRVAACFHYGAVDIDPKHLVVWVLLEGAADEHHRSPGKIPHQPQ
jgi:hypothetical protein